MREKKGARTGDLYNVNVSKVLQFGYTICQWVFAVIITFLAAMALGFAALLSWYTNAWPAASMAAEFAAVLVIALIGGLIPKGDYPIHSLGGELWHMGEWRERLRGLHRKTWLNWLPDVFAFLPLLFIFVAANFIISWEWIFAFPAWAMISVNCGLAVAATVMIPLVTSKAHQEVDEQVEANKSVLID